MTIREELFKNYRSRTSEKWRAKEDKAEEFKKQKVKRSDDEWNYAGSRRFHGSEGLHLKGIHDDKNNVWL